MFFVSDAFWSQWPKAMLYNDHHHPKMVQKNTSSFLFIKIKSYYRSFVLVDANFYLFKNGVLNGLEESRIINTMPSTQHGA